MNKLMKAAAVVVMVGGTAFGGTVAHADDTPAVGSFCTVINPGAGDGRGGDDPSGFISGNPQIAKCDQEFEAGEATVIGAPPA